MAVPCCSRCHSVFVAPDKVAPALPASNRDAAGGGNRCLRCCLQHSLRLLDTSPGRVTRTAMAIGAAALAAAAADKLEATNAVWLMHNTWKFVSRWMCQTHLLCTEV